MIKNRIKACKINDEAGNINIQQVDLNEIFIELALSGFTMNFDTPLFDIEAISPATISIIAVSSEEFAIVIISPQYNLEVIVPSLILEVFSPGGMKIIEIIAPPIEE